MYEIKKEELKRIEYLTTLTVVFWLILLDLFVASLPTTLFSVWNWENDIDEGEGIIGK